MMVKKIWEKRQAVADSYFRDHVLFLTAIYAERVLSEPWFPATQLDRTQHYFNARHSQAYKLAGLHRTDPAWEPLIRIIVASADLDSTNTAGALMDVIKAGFNLYAGLKFPELLPQILNTPEDKAYWENEDLQSGVFVFPQHYQDHYAVMETRSYNAKAKMNEEPPQEEGASDTQSTSANVVNRPINAVIGI